VAWFGNHATAGWKPCYRFEALSGCWFEAISEPNSLVVLRVSEESRSENLARKTRFITSCKMTAPYRQRFRDSFQSIFINHAYAASLFHGHVKLGSAFKGSTTGMILSGAFGHGVHGLFAPCGDVSIAFLSPRAPSGRPGLFIYGPSGAKNGREAHTVLVLRDSADGFDCGATAAQKPSTSGVPKGPNNDSPGGPQGGEQKRRSAAFRHLRPCLCPKDINPHIVRKKTRGYPRTQRSCHSER